MALEIQVIRQQLQSCVAQRDQSAQTFQQCVGAIAVLEEQLKVIVIEEMKNNEAAAKLEQERLKAEQEAGNTNDAATMDGLPCEGEQKDGEVEHQEQVEAPKE